MTELLPDIDEYAMTCGACPTQLEGRFAGRLFYFRYRHGNASLELNCDPADMRDPIFSDGAARVSEQIGGEWDGWMAEEDALEWIRTQGRGLLATMAEWNAL